ncbi:transposase [Spartinivicinus ruber]|uniref:transposase n=1 Tax=Spartinivicinus ruber TaxID=2683272 RepID=UPI0013D85027|nr:transposase [Spartinivicinus ruber]
MKKPNYSTEFKVDSANLVIYQGYSAKEAAEAVGVSESGKPDCKRACFTRGSTNRLSGKQ